MNNAIQSYERLTSEDHLLPNSDTDSGIDNFRFQTYSNDNIVLFSKMQISHSPYFLIHFVEEN